MKFEKIVDAYIVASVQTPYETDVKVYGTQTLANAIKKNGYTVEATRRTFFGRERVYATKEGNSFVVRNKLFGGSPKIRQLSQEEVEYINNIKVASDSLNKIDKMYRSGNLWKQSFLIMKKRQNAAMIGAIISLALGNGLLGVGLGSWLAANGAEIYEKAKESWENPTNIFENVNQ